jgi:predicted lipoprotein
MMRRLYNDGAAGEGSEPHSRGVVYKTSVLLCVVVIGTIFSLSGCTLWTVQSLNPAEGTENAGSAVPGQPDFEPAAYAESIWQSQVLPAAEQSATDLQTLLTALRSDVEGAKQQYGHREGQRPFNFLVKGEAKVLSVDTSSRAGTIKIDLVPGDGQPDATLQVGPVIRGTSVRDALPFIQFNLFTNQLEYADVSNALNDKVVKEAIGSLDVPTLQGKTIDFQGAFTLEEGGNVNDVLITPVKIQPK